MKLTEIKKEDKIILVEKCKELLNLKDAKLPDEYYYSSLPLCVIDSIFSINSNYTSVKNVIKRYCTYFNINPLRESSSFPSTSNQLSVKSFIDSYEKIGVDFYTQKIFNNRQRTSAVNGILKSEAVYEFCKVLNKYNINYFQDVKNIYGNKEFEKDIRNIKGQGKGVSLLYFLMLSGEEDKIKPDRMIIRFLEEILQRKINIDESQILLKEASVVLSKEYPNLSPRLLDYTIWEYTRGN